MHRYFYIMITIWKQIPTIIEEFEFGNGHAHLERGLLILFLIACYIINFFLRTSSTYTVEADFCHVHRTTGDEVLNASVYLHQNLQSELDWR